MLSDRKMELERRVHAILEENELLQHTVDDLREKTMLLERQWNEKELQVGNAKILQPQNNRRTKAKNASDTKSVAGDESRHLGEKLMYVFVRVLYTNVHTVIIILYYIYPGSLIDIQSLFYKRHSTRVAANHNILRFNKYNILNEHRKSHNKTTRT